MRTWLLNVPIKQHFITDNADEEIQKACDGIADVLEQTDWAGLQEDAQDEIEELILKLRADTTEEEANATLDELYDWGNYYGVFFS